jgi:hypothetical protein
MDTYREYKYLNDLWNSGEAPWRKRVLAEPAFSGFNGQENEQ